MMKKSLYKIERYWEYPYSPELNKWVTLSQFHGMQKSFAQGAWSMLKSYYNQDYKHRLVKDDIVLEECSKQDIMVN